MQPADGLVGWEQLIKGSAIGVRVKTRFSY